MGESPDIKTRLAELETNEELAAKVAKLVELETMRRRFDENFYREQHPETNFEEMEPVVHFDAIGWQQGKDPTSWFSVSAYLAQHEDVRNSGLNPFLHYLVYGLKEGRRTSHSSASGGFKNTANQIAQLGIADRSGNHQIVNNTEAQASRASIVNGVSVGEPRPKEENVDGWFRLALQNIQTSSLDGALGSTVSFTQEDSLQRHANNFPAFMSGNASRRYVSLERQIAMAGDIVDRQARGSSCLSIMAYLKQIHIAHAQILKGVQERNVRPEPLIMLKFENPKVSIVIAVYNNFWVTYNCIAALLLSPNETTFEVIVVDDGSTDLTIELPLIVSNIVYVQNEVNVGFVESSNKGAEIAKGDYIVMLNNDTEPGPCWIDELLAIFRDYPDAGLVGPKFVFPNGNLQEAGGIISAKFEVSNYGRNKNPFEPIFNYVRQANYISGACIMIPKSVWQKLGGFDKLYSPAYFEDTDLAFRVGTLGLKTYYTPFAEVVHFEGLSNGVLKNSGVKKYQEINEPKFFRRWANVIRQLPDCSSDLAKDYGILLRALVIDYKTPEPDRDGGSYAAIQEMRILQKLGFKLTFVPTNLAYMGNYTEDLQRRGIECLYAPYQRSIEDVIRNRGSEFDIVYVTRYNVAQNFIGLIRECAPRAKIIFCNADLHFLREMRASVNSKNSFALSAALDTREAELSVMRRVDITLTYSDAEMAVISSHTADGTKVALCPWVADFQEEVPSFVGRVGIAFLGNFQHPPNEEALLFFIEEIMPRLRRATAGIILYVYGSNISEYVKSVVTDDIIVEGYVENVLDVYNRHRIFVAPLLSGAGIKGKVVGALAAGTPIVMTSLAAEGIGVSRGADALVVDHPDEWVKAIISLYNDEVQWSEMSIRSRAFAMRNYSLERGIKTMRSALFVAGVYV